MKYTYLKKFWVNNWTSIFLQTERHSRRNGITDGIFDTMILVRLLVNVLQVIGSKSGHIFPVMYVPHNYCEHSWVTKYELSHSWNCIEHFSRLDTSQDSQPHMAHGDWRLWRTHESFWLNVIELFLKGIYEEMNAPLGAFESSVRITLGNKSVW